MIKWMMGRLQQIRIRLKYRGDHTGKIKAKLAREYRSLFCHMRFKKIKLLELGIDYGGSLLFWSDFFIHPGTRIIGVDINNPSEKTFPRRVTVTLCDQNDSNSLKKMAAEFGPFDIIIDDASHLAKETDNSFKTLFQYVVPGGYYIIEDWGVGYLGEKFNGMNDVITRIILDAPLVGIESLRVIWNSSTLAIFMGSTAIFRKKK